MTYRFETERLILRRLEKEDAPRIQQFAGAYEVASNTLTMPHPYEDGLAEPFIERVNEEWDQGNAYVFCIASKSDNLFMGVLGVHLSVVNRKAEIGYWIGVPFWNKGYVTEAARRGVQFGFEDLKLNRIEASYYTRNPASGRIMQKIGMTYEGTMRQHYLRFGEFVDVGYYSILRSEYDAANTTSDSASH
jgi:[ribosomal protein S5]-alanine N-acetyltransferase